VNAFLLKRWFLVLLAVGLTLAAYRPGWLQPLTDRLEPRIVVGAALFFMAASLEGGRLVRALLHPLPALWAVFVSYALLPALAWMAGALLPEGDLRIGLIIVASVPCTLASAVLWTRLAGGDEAVALLVILLTTAASWLVTTGWLVWMTGTEVVTDVGGMMRNLLLVLLVPVALGQLGRTLAPLRRTLDRHQVALGVVARLLVLSIILRAAVDVSIRLTERPAELPFGPVVLTLILCLATHLAALTVGFWGGLVLGFDRPSRIAVAFASSQKTLPVALYLFDTYFKGAAPLAVLPLVFYHVGQLVVDTFIADDLTRRGRPRSQTAEGGSHHVPM
jgi:solute carrier family 10 (sodium/bile acid cotransporter), member 7